MAKKLGLAVIVCMVILAILAVWFPSLANALWSTFGILGVVLFLVFLWGAFSAI